MKNNLALLSYLTVCIVWGSTYLAIRVGVTDMHFLAFTGIRYFTAGVIMLTIAKINKWSFPRSGNEYKIIIIAGLLLLFISNGLISWGSQWLESNMTALLVASLPLFMALIEHFLPGAPRIGKFGWVGLIIGFVGVAFLVSPHINIKGEIFIAMVAVLVASLNWAAASIYLKRKTLTTSIMPIAGIQMVAAGTAFLISAFLTGELTLSETSTRGYIAMFYLIIFGSTIAYTAFNYMIKVMPAAKAGTYAYVNPVIAVILGALILQEAVTLQSVVSAAIILGGVVIVQVSKTNRPKKEDPVAPALKSHKA